MAKRKEEDARPDETGEVELKNGKKRKLKISAASADLIRKLATERRKQPYDLLTQLAQKAEEEGYKSEYITGAEVRIWLL